MAHLAHLLLLLTLPLTNAQGVLLTAQGTASSTASLGFQVNPDPASGDANIINESEINANVVNECGRTLLLGNIDIGTVTEAALANGSVTSVTKGSTVDVVIRSGSAEGEGPYTCDLDLCSNADGVSGQTKLVVQEKDGGNGDVTLSVVLPQDLACIGASTGNICTVRCFNNATTGPFGGCFAIQQTDIAPNENTADNIETAQTLEGVLAQVAQNQIDLPKAIKANVEAANEEEQGVLAVDELLGVDSLGEATAGAVESATSSVAAVATSASTTRKGSGNGNRKSGDGNSSGNRNGNGNKNNRNKAKKAVEFSA